MITRISLDAFKAFQSLRISLRPITVIAGANSSGKSSLIQSLLLLRQTLEGRRNRPLILNGEYLQLSEYSDVVFGKLLTDNFSIGLRFKTETLPSDITDERLGEFFGPAEIDLIRESRPQMQTEYHITFGFHPDNQDIYVQQGLIHAQYGPLIDRPFRLEFNLDGNVYSGSITTPQIDTLGLPIQEEFTDIVAWYYFLPQRISRAIDVEGEELEVDVKILDLLGLQVLIDTLSQQLHYIGPLRSEPQRAYLGQVDRSNLDFRGGNVLQVLLDEQHRLVSFPIKGTDRVEEIPLIDAVNRTLTDVLGLHQTIKPLKLNNVVNQLALPLDMPDEVNSLTRSGEKYVTIADVGFGISQVLPVIVAGLLAKPGETLVVEQPEAHLHPRVQSSLADFFVLLFQSGKNVIVETHSEHLINGFREQMAMDLDNQLSLHKNFQLVFVQPAPSNDRIKGASYTEMTFDEYGYGIEWPPEFLPRSTIESQELLRLIAEKRKFRRNKNKANES
ncbi:AAA family ATPase [Candidatus Chloroploca sp. M-50]|uniref:AAA family ATPase n=1 Tax=Candidatus Chloroploca mongolica TaxID=2528176 RepID=A0ABS4DH56_9CHLR|nr:AAA family ATPase [Candidatus Chloroploca mongolica]